MGIIGEWHGYNKKYKDLNTIQKRNRRVDEIKNQWAIEHGFLLVRIWEHDINKNPSKVIEYLKDIIGEADKKAEILENKKKRH